MTIPDDVRAIIHLALIEYNRHTAMGVGVALAWLDAQPAAPEVMTIPEDVRNWIASAAQVASDSARYYDVDPSTSDAVLAWLEAQPEAPELYIWWLNQAEHEAVSRLGAPHPYDANVVATMEWPVYLAKEFRSLEGRPLHGRLWVATHIDLTGIEWDEDKPASRLASERGGIVIEACDLPVVFDLPGFVTDLHLNFANALCRRVEVTP